MFWNWLGTLGTWGIILELLIIVLCKVIEVSVGTVRAILVVKGYRKIALILAFVEILLWVYIASRVITGLVDDPLKGLAYSVGYAAGVYLGSMIEEKLAFGMVNIQIISTIEEAPKIASQLRSEGYGVTTLLGEGRSEKRSIIMVVANRRGSAHVIEEVENITTEAVIFVNDIVSLRGGFLKKNPLRIRK